jgi:uncharacterized membrane protein
MISMHAALCFISVSDQTWGADWVWGCPLIVLTVIIHVLGLAYISRKAIQIYEDGGRRRRHPQIALTAVLGSVTLLATILHAAETAIWAAAYLGIGALPNYRSGMLYSLGAMTTYGHQDLFLKDSWKLLGGLEALNGWLLFGLSTAFLFWLIQQVTSGKRTVD